MNGNGKIKDLDEELLPFLMEGEEIRLLMVWSNGCKPCESLKRALRELKDEHRDKMFRKVKMGEDDDVERFRMNRFLMGVPTVFVSNGSILAYTMGAGPVGYEKEKYSEILNSLIEGSYSVDKENGEISFPGENDIYKNFNFEVIK